MKSPRITQNSNGHWDLKLTNGKFEFAEDGTQSAQHALQRLLIFRGELSLNGALTEKTDDGTRWYEVIFAMDKSRAEKDLEIKRRILGTIGVKRIIRFSWVQADHTVTIDGAIQTDWGAEDISAEITPL
jgi:hypothetical protein